MIKRLIMPVFNIDDKYNKPKTSKNLDLFEYVETLINTLNNLLYINV